jgi:arsenate reductase (thioredoxin)
METTEHASSDGSADQPSPNDQDDSQKTSRNSYNVLFLSRDNSVRSIIAEALLKRWGGHEFRAFSAGVQPNGKVHPITLDVLKTEGLWHQNFRSKNFEEFLAPEAPRMDFVVDLGDQPTVVAPRAWPGNPQVVRWRISDPGVDRSPKEAVHALSKMFVELETRIKLFVLVYQREAKKTAAAA